MSWKEKIQTQLIIQTGDGKEYKPNWIPGQKAIDYNIAEFEFPNISGTLVSRKTPKGRKIPLEFYFQGENHLDESQAFETSANDSRAWSVTHPFYGRIIVQPVSLSIDNTGLNISKISCPLIETITEDFPKVVIDSISRIAADADITNSAFADNFSNDIVPDQADISELSDINNKLYTSGSKFADAGIAEEYFNAFNTANSAITEATSEPLAAMRALQTVISTPAKFASSVNSRMTVLTDQFTSLRTSLPTEKSLKNIFQSVVGTLLSAMGVTVSSPLAGDYGNRTDVIAAIESLIANYDNYLLDLDSMQSDNGGHPDSFIPDVNSLIALNDLINFTLSNLFNIAQGAKQERSIIVENDTNLILLAHRFYGLKEDDSTIEELMRNNNIALNQILQVPKNRKIIYYV